MSCIFFTRDFGYLFKSSLRAMVSKCFANFCHLPSQVLSRICLGSISLFALVGCVLCFCNPAICSVSIVQLPMSDFHCICTIPNLPPNRGRPIHIGVESLLDHSESRVSCTASVRKSCLFSIAVGRPLPRLRNAPGRVE